jgi:hypothetical protein
MSINHNAHEHTTEIHRLGKEEVLPALRELLSRHPAAASSSPVKLAGLLRILCYLPRRPGPLEVAAALEALEVDGEVAA